MHRCENIIGHPPSVAIDKPTTTTTNTTTTPTILTTHDNNDTIEDTYVVISSLFSTVNVDNDKTTHNMK